ncbi:unnamed protein product [Linum trigynum]|uniref:Reverse transcriptase zinc-binding domain-containing protein n=1 Tax=Linum trigynum TaxID=586398 RepID=A0AAV2CL56_9ROSI
MNVGWRKLWKLNVPGKIKVFLWKVAHNIVPVGVKIRKKSIRRGYECPNCGMKETLKQCLVNCSWEESSQKLLLQTCSIWLIPSPAKNGFSR